VRLGNAEPMGDQLVADPFGKQLALGQRLDQFFGEDTLRGAFYNTREV
jgi:hypothetical protein